MASATEPKTLQEAIVYFSDLDNCQAYMVARRWPNGVSCPTCGASDVRYLANQRRWECKAKHAKKQFSIKIGTIFEDSPIGLDKWLAAAWMVTAAKNGISSWEIHRSLGVTQKTAWFMLQRIRLAMQDERTGGKLGGSGNGVEVDETYIGGKARNMHKGRKAKVLEGRGGGAGHKVGVQGILERGGEVRTEVLNRPHHSWDLVANVQKNVAPSTKVFTDELKAYFSLQAEYEHEFVNHTETYVKGNIHTNGLENFWSLLKRGLGGTYVSVEPFHLFRYVDEQAFRYNHRKEMNDADRFEEVIRRAVGRRLTYEQLTGKTQDQEDRTTV